MKQQCELCGLPARICCESDQASLCWACDEKVHGANFLVAKHSRCLLCHICQSPTPWKASGARFCPIVSVCQVCVGSYGNRRPDRGGGETQDEDDCDDHSEGFSEYSGDDEDDDEDEEEEEEEEEGENQVVPWSCSASTPPPPAASSSCSDGDSLSSAVGGGASPLKRSRQNAGLDSDDEINSGSSTVNDEASSLGLIRPLKQPRRTSELLNQLQRLDDDGETEPRSGGVVTTVERLQRRVVNGDDEATSFVYGLRKLSRDRSR